ncbi:hypothetical protein CJ030_MR3G008420 [Morella rubra]|uniref:Uncharacterized protein n=1 Tax=Morella rubra TaxID=262757 RepID=A0A6A1W2J9_9ROSI|nr:hypothetical protein CJ030_MR3G008420 [Morella rubra]
MDIVSVIRNALKAAFLDIIAELGCESPGIVIAAAKVTVVMSAADHYQMGFCCFLRPRRDGPFVGSLVLLLWYHLDQCATPVEIAQD